MPIEELLKLMATLRDKERGCPWDIEQTFKTIAPHTIEEAYEVADAIARNHMDDVKEELGDLLLQVVFHAQMAKEEGHFTFEDVVAAVVNKMIVRHPHVFGDKEIKTAAEQISSWEAIKAQERAEKKTQQQSILDDIPASFPALLRASKLQKRASQVGFQWPNIAPMLEKLDEEILELKEAITEEDKDAIQAEIGDVFFMLSNLCNHFHFSPEDTLQHSNHKFIRRFKHVEKQLAKQGRGPKDATLAEMDTYWDEAKFLEKHPSEAS